MQNSKLWINILPTDGKEMLWNGVFPLKDSKNITQFKKITKVLRTFAVLCVARELKKIKVQMSNTSHSDDRGSVVVD